MLPGSTVYTTFYVLLVMFICSAAMVRIAHIVVRAIKEEN